MQTGNGNASALFLIASAIALAPLGAAHARSGGPPDGRTGAPTTTGVELTCVTHHASFAPVNSGIGSLEIAGPQSYEPDETYLITVALEHPGQMRWGFQLTAIDNEDLLAAGSFAALDSLVQISTLNPRPYVKHTSVGTAAGQLGGQQWSFEWTAPAEDVGPVSLYAAGNAANGNLGTSGDYIYTASLQILPEPAGALAGCGALGALCALRCRRA